MKEKFETPHDLESRVNALERKLEIYRFLVETQFKVIESKLNEPKIIEGWKAL